MGADNRIMQRKAITSLILAVAIVSLITMPVMAQGGFESWRSINMTGITNSHLTIGMDGVENSYLTINSVIVIP